MRIELKPFQEEAAQALLGDVAYARDGVRRGREQAVVLSSPTGSGKTVILTQLLEWIWQGDDQHEGDKKATFLWLSDSPELNLQSRDKIARQSSVFPESDLIVIESPFSMEKLEPGKVYFLNTQKMSKSSQLVKQADKQEFTIWQTIENTIRSAPDHFYLVLDEAHRGTKEGRDRNEASSIMQRFVKGYPEGNLKPVPLIIGMSATPERFENLIEGTNRTKHPRTIDPQAVKLSGLLKEKIVLFHPKDARPSDWSLLEEATRRWQRYCKDWKSYCKAQKMDAAVEPVLAIQVEDGTEKQLTKTSLENIMSVVERVAGKLPDAAWAHAFQDDASVKVSGREIRKIDASKIENDGSVQVVLFKMSLTTGWDCPRAEVMMSFRRAVDSTLIAQLIGRMVRTPLARKIEGTDLLNSVALFLPHYHGEEVTRIVTALNNPDPEQGTAIDVIDGDDLETIRLDPKLKQCAELYQRLPSYFVERIPKMSHTRRLVRFARYLALDAVNTDILEDVKKLLVDTLEKEANRLKKNANFIGNMKSGAEIEVAETWVPFGEVNPSTEKSTFTVKATEENIEDLFSHSGRSLGEGLHMEYWREKKDSDPLRRKLEIIGLMMEEQTMPKIEEVALKKLREIEREYHKAIQQLPSSAQERYRSLKRVAKDPEETTVLLPESMELKKEGEQWQRHLFKDEKGMFSAKLYKWEAKVVKEIIEADKSVIGWLRILPRKDWALCIPYEKHNEQHPLYPDIVAFRKTKSGIVVDLFDPHGTHLDDAVEKAKGMASFARKHGMDFGRIDLIIVNEDDKLRRLNLNDEAVRSRIDRIDSNEHLRQLIDDLGD